MQKHLRASVEQKKLKQWTFFKSMPFLLLLVCLILYGLYAFYGQKIIDSYKNRTIAEEKISDQRVIMSRFLLALNQPSILEEGEEHYEDLKSVYDDLIEFEGEKITFEEYKDYFKAFHEFLNGEVEYFRAMKTEDALLYKGQVLKFYPQFLDHEHNLQFYWLHLKEQTLGLESQVPFVLFVKEDRFYFPSAWIKDSIQIHALQKVYWHTIQNQNKTLLKTYLPTDLAEDFLERKAERILEYYKTYDKALRSRKNIALLGRFMQIQQLLPQELTEHFQTVEEESKYYRFVNFNLDQNQGLKVQEIIPEILDENQFKIYFKNKLVLTLGQVLNVKHIIDQFGWWGDQLEVVNLEEKDSTGRNLQKIKLSYDGIKFEILGTFDEATNYIYGTLVYVEIDNAQYTLKKQDQVGQLQSELLLKYPFLEEQRYILKDLEGRFIEYHFNEDKILEKMILVKNS